jgi:hypothetical protein
MEAEPGNSWLLGTSAVIESWVGVSFFCCELGERQRIAHDPKGVTKMPSKQRQEERTKH